MIEKYKKIPVEIEAMEFSLNIENRIQNMNDICNWINKGKGPQDRHAWHNGADIFIQTLEGVMKATCGDFIIKGVQGEFYPCKPDIFKATYQK